MACTRSTYLMAAKVRNFLRIDFFDKSGKVTCEDRLIGETNYPNKIEKSIPGFVELPKKPRMLLLA